MKKILIILFIMNLNNISYSNEIKCQTTLQKLRPACNFIGKGTKKLKSISDNNKTINQTLENAGILKKDRKKMTLKELNEKYKTIKLGNKK